MISRTMHVTVRAIGLGLVLLALIATRYLAGQTQVRAPQQLTASTTAPCIFVSLVQKIACAVLDQSVILNLSVTPPIISATLPALPAVVAGEQYTAMAGQTIFPLAHTPRAGTLALYRNGLHQYSPADYSLSGGTVTFTSGSQVTAGDTIGADYQF